MIVLDTSFLIRALARGSAQDARLREWLRNGEEVGMSAIAWAELLCRPIEPEAVDLAARVVSRRVAFGEEDATVAARLFNDTGRRRGSLTDCMIAATALRLDAPLATDNPADFRRFEPAGLRLAGM
ncbi:MAG TPA: PIN domain-containing protein [Burkholderiales bacterium]|nr:PIN domain-containing protein [Burkholderiales bacterium]